MATKLKNIPYKIWVKIAVIVVFFGVLSVFGNVLYESILHGEALIKKEYYETEYFQKHYIRLSHNVLDKYLELVSEESIRNRTDIDIEASVTRLNIINSNLNNAKAFRYVLINSETSEIITNIENKEWIGSFDSVQAYIEQLDTVVQWDSTGIYFPVKSELDTQKSLYKEFTIEGNKGITSIVSVDEVLKRLQDGPWSYYTAVDFQMMDEDVYFGTNYHSFEDFKEGSQNYIPTIIICIITMFLIFTYLGVVAGKASHDSQIKLLVYDQVPFEVQTLISVVSCIPIALLVQTLSPPFEETNVLLTMSALLSFSVGIVIVEFMSIMRTIKAHALVKHSLINKFFIWLRQMFNTEFTDGRLKTRTVGFIIVYTVLNAIVLGFLFVKRESTYGIYLLGLWVFIDFLVIKRLFDGVDELNKLIFATKKRAEGESDYPIDESEYSERLTGFAKDLNALQNGLQLALEDAIKGEKLKTELITNVSHDLKNPLTSIVTYVDLLEKEVEKVGRQGVEDSEQLEQIRNTISEYTKVLGKKSHRLKFLIEDLVAASKASSGNLEVDLQRLDLVQLLQQCLGEKEEHFTSSKLQTIIQRDSKKPIYVMADPNHIFRVFENLFSNILKYSMEGTRVYIQTKCNEHANEVAVSLKNISNHPLDIEANLLTQRFVRGDEARTTEGSGLGLSIVESLLHLQGGRLDINVDGDLFKAIVTLKIATQETIESEKTDEILALDQVYDVKMSQ